MKKSRFSEEQIIGILKEHQAGIAVAPSDEYEKDKSTGSEKPREQKGASITRKRDKPTRGE